MSEFRRNLPVMRTRIPKIRRHVVTTRQPGDQAPTIASRHFTARAARRRADWLRRLSALDGADVRVRRIDDQTR